MQLNNKILQDPLAEKVLPLFAQKLKINHFSPTQFSLPDAAWLFKYVVLTQEQRRNLLNSNSAMEAGKIVGNVLLRHYADTVYKINPLTKKVAPTSNEKLSIDLALQEQIEYLKNYVPIDDKDSDKKIKYLEEIPQIVINANNGLKKLAVTSPITCERQISLTNESDSSFLSYPSLSIVGRIDFDFGNVDVSASHGNSFPSHIVELKTKYSRLGRSKKDGSRSFINTSSPVAASFNHCVQVATYAANFDFKVPVHLLYATQNDFQIFDSTNCRHLTVEGMKKNLQIMNRTFMRREKILSLFQDETREEIIDHAVSMMDMNLDHPYAWNGLPANLLSEAKELWKLN